MKSPPPILACSLLGKFGPRTFGLAVLLVAAGASLAQSTDWTHLAGDTQRLSSSPSDLPNLGHVLWTRNTDAAGNPIRFTPQSGVVGASGRVFATGKVSPPGGPANQQRLFCFDALTGVQIWSVAVGAVAGESYSTPCIDTRNQTVIHGSDRFLVAYDFNSGAVRWSRQLTKTIVNASPLVTSDRAPRNRCFITDYDGYAASAKIYCINVDPFNAVLNPFLPGQVVWTAPILGAAGNSPAYIPSDQGGNDLVFVASVGVYIADLPGSIYAFPIDSVGTPSPVWMATSPDTNGFFGGVAAVGPGPDRPHGAIYAATYAFSERLQSATLVKLDATNGNLLWSTPCNRTSTIPVPLPDGKVLLSTGVTAYGSALSVELFREDDHTVRRVWNSALGTWDDLDEDGEMEPGEYTAIGGYSVQPVVRISNDHVKALCGVGSSNPDVNEDSNEIYVLDLDTSPCHEEFIEQYATGAGSSPAIVGGIVCSVGAAGLRAFGEIPPAYDVNQDGVTSIDDLYSWEQGLGLLDVNQDSSTDATDRAILLAYLRRLERNDLEATR
ncbi:MAG: PQQ-binding-like beta-propeller repeat protein [Phycisphaerales bacterium]